MTIQEMIIFFSFWDYLIWFALIFSIIMCIKRYRDIELKSDEPKLMKKKNLYLGWASGIFFIGGAWLADIYSW
jgi:hypothetical protein